MIMWSSPEMDVNRGEGLDGEHASPGIGWFPNPLAADFFEVRWGPCLSAVARSETLRTPQNVPIWLYPCPTILLGPAARRAAMASYIKKFLPGIFSAALGIKIFCKWLLDCCAFVLFDFCARQHHQHQLNFKLGKVKPCHMHRHCQNFKKKTIINIFFYIFRHNLRRKKTW